MFTPKEEYMNLKKSVLSVLLLLIVITIGAQESPANEAALDFDLGIGLETRSIENPVTGQLEPWNNISLRPELSIGKFGIGLAIDVNFAFSNADGSPGFRIREEDWIPDPSQNRTILDLYVPMIRYIRYGYKGDPFYAAIGAMDNFTLGNGFIMSNYSNTRLLPDRRISGLALDLDAAIFSFPYVGLEAVVGNIAAFDLLGGRIYVRPIHWIGVDAIKELQLGFTAVVDRNPFFHEMRAPLLARYSTRFDDEKPVLVFGGDIRLPIVSVDLFSFAIFGDIVSQNGNLGGMAGLGGKLFDLVTYGAQMRFLDQNFIPNYFDTYYDLYRVERWEVYNAGKDTVRVPAYNGWLANLGLDVLNSKIVFDATLEGPLEINTEIDQLNPTFTAGFHLDPSLLGGFSLDASYQKKYIKDIADLISPENTVVNATIGYNIGGVNISLIYDLKYDSTPGPAQTDKDGNPQYWTINTRFETSFSLF